MKNKNNILKIRARQLRKNSTDAENHLWYLLKNRCFNKHKFRRQHVIGQYIADFVCLEKKLIIELDGGQHAEAQEYDEKRTVYLNQQGFKILRFWNRDVFKETENIGNEIYRVLEDECN